MRLISGLRRQQGQREVYINSPAPTHTSLAKSLATLNNFLLLLSANRQLLNYILDICCVFKFKRHNLFIILTIASFIATQPTNHN
jgi:hypothetical protein